MKKTQTQSFKLFFFLSNITGINFKNKLKAVYDELNSLHCLHCLNFIQITLFTVYTTHFKRVKNFKILGCNMSLKIHFLVSHLDSFPENLGDYSEEQGERFHQDIAEMEKRYQGRWDIHMMVDYCWSMKRERERERERERGRRYL